jgi:hypothetical protein
LAGLFLCNSKVNAQSKFPSNRRSSITFGLGLEYLWAKADGKGKYTGNSIDGTEFGYGDLNLSTDRLGIPVFDFYFGSNVHQLHLEYMQYNLSGIKSITKNLTIDGSAYASGDSLSTDLETKWGRLYYEFFDVRDSFSYGILLGVESYTFDYKVNDITTNVRNKFDMQTINPLLGTHVIMGQGKYALKLSAFYVPKLFGIIDYNTLDLSAAAVFNFGDYMQIEGGYRFINTTIDGSGKIDHNTLKLKGLFATLRIKY